jgi:hypothetical protein
MKAVVDGLNETELLCQGMNGADAAVADTVDAVGSFIVNVGGGEDGSMATTKVIFVESSLDATLAVFQPPL